MCRPQSSLIRRWSSRASSSVFGNSLKDVYDGPGSSQDTDTPVRGRKKNKSPYDHEGNPPSVGRFSLLLNIKFISVTIILSTAAAFSIGCVARILLLADMDTLPAHRNSNDLATQIYLAECEGGTSQESKQLPAPTIIPGKTVPYTTYASKTFRAEGSATSHTLHVDRREATKVTSDVNKDFVVIVEEEDDELVINDYSHNDDSDELHLPAGQHLLVDIKDVDSEFLNSEVRLASAMVNLIKESKLTLLSYHCHSLVPIGVSCAGVLLESHVAFHTWPNEGVITMDLSHAAEIPSSRSSQTFKNSLGSPAHRPWAKTKTPSPNPPCYGRTNSAASARALLPSTILTATRSTTIWDDMSSGSMTWMLSVSFFRRRLPSKLWMCTI